MQKYFSTQLFLTIFAIAGLLFSSLSLQAATSSDAIGKITKIEGSAYAVSGSGQRRALTVGASIFEKDQITTEDDGLLTVLFNDKTRFELGSNATLEASEYAYKQTEEDSVSLKMLKGAFRFVTGLVAKAKPESMKVGTAVATIGIRGTHVIGEADASSATIILMAAEDNSRKSAIDVYNDYGKVSIDEPGYGTEIPDEFSPPSPPRRMALQTINNLTRSMQQINRINMPRPRPGMP